MDKNCLCKNLQKCDRKREKKSLQRFVVNCIQNKTTHVSGLCYAQSLNNHPPFL